MGRRKAVDHRRAVGDRSVVIHRRAMVYGSALTRKSVVIHRSAMVYGSALARKSVVTRGMLALHRLPARHRRLTLRRICRLSSSNMIPASPSRPIAMKSLRPFAGIR